MHSIARIFRTLAIVAPIFGVLAVGDLRQVRQSSLARIIMSLFWRTAFPGQMQTQLLRTAFLGV